MAKRKRDIQLKFRVTPQEREMIETKMAQFGTSFFDHNSSGEIRKIIDDNAAETHKTVAHLIPDNVTAVMPIDRKSVV